MPSVTFVVPCFNYGRFVGEAVASCLAQVGARVWVVVVNDGSDDGESAAACDACAAMRTNVAVVHQANAGLPAARNAGAAVGRERAWGEYLVFLDADDTVEPTFVSALARAMREAGDDRVSHAYCQERLTERGKGIWRVPEWDPTLLMVTNLHPVTALVRRACFEQVGGFDATMRKGYEDWDFWLKFAERGWRGVRVREPLFNWRRHSDDTMVMDAVKRHEELFTALVHRHPAMYASAWMDIIRLSNVLLRRADANWLDESGEAIVLRDLKAWTRDLVLERDSARGEVSERERRIVEMAGAHAEAMRRLQAEGHERERSVRAEYEAKPSVRASRAMFRMLERVPRPLTVPVRLAARLARKKKTGRE